MNTLKRIDHDRTFRRLQKKTVPFKFPLEQRIVGQHEKPPQPTILRATTARSLAYLERHGLADFRGCNLTVQQTRRWDHVLRKWVPFTDSLQGVGV